MLILGLGNIEGQNRIHLHEAFSLVKPDLRPSEGRQKHLRHKLSFAHCRAGWVSSGGPPGEGSPALKPDPEEPGEQEVPLQLEGWVP